MEGWQGGFGMTRKLQHIFALSERGAKDLVKAVIWCFACNISLMIPIGVVMAVVMHLLRVMEKGINPMVIIGFILGGWLGCAFTVVHPSLLPVCVSVSGNLPRKRQPENSAWPKHCESCPFPSLATGT